MSRLLFFYPSHITHISPSTHGSHDIKRLLALGFYDLGEPSEVELDFSLETGLEAMRPCLKGQCLPLPACFIVSFSQIPDLAIKF